MVSETMILAHLRRTLGDVLMDTFPATFYLNIIENETLYSWSAEFPYIVHGICIRKRDAITSVHPQTNVTIRSQLYKIPKETEDIEYLGIEEFLYPANMTQNQVSSNLPALNGVLNLIRPSLPSAQYYNIVRYNGFFTPPDILEIRPPPMVHLDFTVSMQRKPKLYEIPMYYRRYFLELCEYDCKLALWAKFRNLRDGATYQGLEINTSFISELAEAKGERKELLDLLRKNSMKDPTRISAVMSMAN